MNGYKVIAENIKKGNTISRTISESEYENLKKSQFFNIVSAEKVSNYAEPGFLLSKHKIGSVM